MKEVKQNFGRYLRRRRVKDVAAWLDKMSITSVEDLEGFWASLNLEGDVSAYEAYFSKATSDEQQVKPASKSEKKKEEAWHVPAAKRPLTRGSRKTTSRTTKKATKKTNKGD